MKKLLRDWSRLSVKDFFSGLLKRPGDSSASGEPDNGKPPRKIEDFKHAFSIEGPPPEPPKTDAEDVIFPPDGAEGKKAVGTSAVFFKFAGLVGSLAAAYYLGSASSPESMKYVKENFDKLTALALEKSAPALKQIGTAIDSRMGQKTEVPSAGKPAAESPSVKAERKIKYWHDPMIPGYKSDKPGKSPMNMDMIPVYEDEEPVSGDIQINSAMAQNIGLKTEVAKERSLTREIRTIGRLTYDERNLTFIHTKYEGWIEHLYVNFTGQEVQENDLLIDVYSPELVSTQEEMLLALKYSQAVDGEAFPEISRGAQSLLDATRRRLELFDVPEHQIEELLRNKRISRSMHIHSPVRGFVINRNVTHGMYVKPDMHLYTIADLSNIWGLADIFEYELPWVKVGQEAEMQLSYFPGKKFKGKITFIDPFLDPKTRTVKVRIEFDNPQWKLKPDMYANVTLKSEVARKTVAVPEDAVIRAGEKNIVVVKREDGGFESREVSIGSSADKYVQIFSGVKVGETVVTSANFLIDAESKLSEALKKMQPPQAIPMQKTPGEGR